MKRKSDNSVRKKGLDTKVSRSGFLKASGIVAAGATVSALGLGGVASAAPPTALTGFDAPADGRSPISIVKSGPGNLSYAGKYKLNADGTSKTIIEGWPELLQRYILSRERDTEAWQKMVGQVDYLYERMKDLFGEYFKADMASYENLLSIAGDPAKKICLKPNWVLAVWDTDPAFVYDPENPTDVETIVGWLIAHGLDAQTPDLAKLKKLLADFETRIAAPAKRGQNWGGSTAAPFMAALMRYLCEDLGFLPDQIIISEGGDQNEFWWKIFEYSGLPLSVPAFYEGRLLDMWETQSIPVWYGGIGMYWARKYLEEKGFAGSMSGYYNSLVVDVPIYPDYPNYVPPKDASGITIYNSNYLGDNQERRVGLEIPEADRPWNIGADKVYDEILVHESFSDESVCFVLNLPKLKEHLCGNITLAIKNIGLGIPAVWATGTDGGGTPGWEYSTPNNHPNHCAVGVDCSGVACEKFGVPHEIMYGPIVNGLPKMDPPPIPGGYPWPNGDALYFPLVSPDPIPGFFGHYDLQKTGGLGGFMMDANLALKGRFGPNILHIADGIVAANILHEAAGDWSVYSVDEGILAMSADPIALDKCMLRYLYKRYDTTQLGPLGITPQMEGAFFQAAWISQKANGQLYVSPDFGDFMPNWIDETTTESADNRTPWGEAAGLGSGHYYVVGKLHDPANGNAWLGSINGHIVSRKPGSSQAVNEILSSPTLDQGGVYWTMFMGMSMFRTIESYFKAYDELTEEQFGFPLVANPAGCYPGVTRNMSTYDEETGELLETGLLLKCDMVDSNGDFSPDGILSFDDALPDASFRGWAGAFINIPRDVLLTELQKGTDFDTAYLKTVFYTLTVTNRHLNPFWNDDGAGGYGHYYDGPAYAGMVLFYTFFTSALAPGDPDEPYVDEVYAGLAESLTETPHYLIVGTYTSPVANPNDPEGPRLPAGTYMPSPHYNLWLAVALDIYGMGAEVGDFSGSAYEAAAAYAAMNGYAFNFYVPDAFDFGIPSVVPEADPSLLFKAKFYDSDGNEVETWPDSYRPIKQ